MSLSATARGGRPPKIRAEEILDVLALHVDDAWTIGTIASELGVSEAAIYYYFPTKADLVVGLGQRLFSQLELPRRHGDCEAWLAEVGLCLFDFFVRYPLMTNAGVDLLGDTAGETWATDAILDDLVAEGFALTDADTVITTLLVLASGYASMAVFLDGPRGTSLKERVLQRAAADPETSTSRIQLANQAWDIRRRFAASLVPIVAGLGALRVG